MHYTNAIARLPSATCAKGLTTSSLGAPDAQKTRQQFDAYVSTLLGLGLTLTVLPEQPAFPDSHFVEDRGGRAGVCCADPSRCTLAPG